MKQILAFIASVLISVPCVYAAPFVITYPDFIAGQDILEAEMDINNADIVAEINTLTSERIDEADGTSGQDTNTGSGIKTDHIQNDAITEAKIVDTGVRKEHLFSDIAGDGIGQAGDKSLLVNTDDVTIEKVGDTLQVKDDGITGAKILETTSIEVAGFKMTDTPVVDYILTSDAAGTGTWQDIITIVTGLGKGSRIQLTASISATGGNTTGVEFDDLDSEDTPGFDDLDWHSWTTNPSRVTVDLNGRYLVVARCKISRTVGTDAEYTAVIIKNAISSNPVAETTMQIGYLYPWVCSLSGIVDANAGDYFELLAFCSEDYRINAQTYLSVIKIK